MLKAAGRNSCHQGQRASLVLNVLYSSLRFAAITSATLILAILAQPAQARPCFINGSFEIGYLHRWTANGNFMFTQVVSRSFLFGPTAGQERYVTAGPIGSEGFLSQSFLDTPAETYSPPSR